MRWIVYWFLCRFWYFVLYRVRAVFWDTFWHFVKGCPLTTAEAQILAKTRNPFINRLRKAYNARVTMAHCRFLMRRTFQKRFFESLKTIRSRAREEWFPSAKFGEFEELVSEVMEVLEGVRQKEKADVTSPEA